MTPDTVDIPVEEHLRPGLLIITKIVQNLANNVLFGKEQYMMILNDFLEANILAVTQFLSEVVVGYTTSCSIDLDDLFRPHQKKESKKRKIGLDQLTMKLILSFFIDFSIILLTRLGKNCLASQGRRTARARLRTRLASGPGIICVLP